MQKFNDKILVNILVRLIEHFVLPDCSTDVKSQAYTTLVRPHLQYACSVWNPYTKRNIHHIELVQYKAARFVCRHYSNFSHVTPMLKQLGWDPLNDADFRTNYQCFIKSNKVLLVSPFHLKYVH